jgi:hypothetical protein
MVPSARRPMIATNVLVRLQTDQIIESASMSETPIFSATSMIFSYSPALSLPFDSYNCARL